MLFDMSGPGIQVNCNSLFYIMGLYNSVVVDFTFKLLNSSFHFKINDLLKVPIIIDKEKKPQIDELVEENINLSKKDWDSFETSWDFEGHPLV